MWEVVINALQYNYRLKSRLCAVNWSQVPQIILIVTRDAGESAEIVKGCVEQWLAAKSPDAAERLLHFLFDPAAEPLADPPCVANERLLNSPSHGEGPWATA